MEALPLVLRFWLILWFTFVGFSSSSKYPYFTEPRLETTERRPIAFTYSRFPEVEKECESILSSASQLKPDSNRPYDIRSQMSFSSGDWAQESKGAPLMPFDGARVSGNSSSFPDPLYLASFTMMDVDPNRQSPVAINVSGVLSVGIYGNDTYPQKGYLGSPHFQMWKGLSQLDVIFEGVYTESETNGGERVMCLLGTALLPSRQADSTDAWEWMKSSEGGNYQPTLMQDNRILLILRYPKFFTLTTRAVNGDMKSLHEKSNLKYFDEVHFSSQLGAYSDYQFGSENIVSKACGTYPYPDELFSDQMMIYKGFSFCGILERFASGQLFNVMPNWNCNSTDEYCRKLGPFESEKAIGATDGSFKNVRLVMQDVRCEPRHGLNNFSSATVSGVFRALPPREIQYRTQRSGLNGLTLSLEGTWNSSSGQLCMVGCLGSAQAGCASRVCLYVLISFSIMRRNIIMGSISSVDTSKENSYFPLSFERVIDPSEMWNDGTDLQMSYKYTKIESAGAFLERNEPFDFGDAIKKSLLSYPNKEEDGDELNSLSKLWDDLALRVSAVPDSSMNVNPERALIQMKILSLGPFFGRYSSWPLSNVSDVDVDNQKPSKTLSERELLLNVSAELTVTGKPYVNVSLLSLEGLYNQADGRMYLIGCRDVRASWKTLFESMDLDGGLDCLIEARIEYPPTTAQWLINPTALISIESCRSEDDPLHFNPIKLQTLPMLYREQREDILSRKGVEGMLRILTLSLAIGCILSQLFYIRDNTAVVPYISHVMLGVQALGYSIPLITGAEAVLSRLTSETYEAPSYDLQKNQGFQIVNYVVKILVLSAFLLTLRLGQKVWKSRIRLLMRAPLEPRRVPNDKWVLMTCLILHGVGFLIVLIVHTVTASHRPIQSEVYVDSRGHSHKLREWGTELEEYVGLVQDFFLLPQIIGNFLWQIDCKPLRKAYYIGLTVVRLLPHVYDYVRAPVVNPYFSEEYEFVNPSLDFYSKFGDVAIPLIAAVLAAVIYFQQGWSYQKISQKLGLGRVKLFSLGSRVYERLPSMSFEAELVTGVNNTEALDHSRKDEE